MKPSTVTAADLLAGHIPPVIAAVAALRALVLSSLPELDERVHPGWHALAYHHPTARYIGGIFPRADLVSLIFEWGVYLPDPSGILTGKGSRVRAIVCTDADEIPDREIVDLLMAAAEYGNEKFSQAEAE